MPMLTDNQWHEAILLKHKDGTFGLYDDQQEAKSTAADRLPEKIQYQQVKYNWNHGQPEVDLGDFKVSICDMDIK